MRRIWIELAFKKQIGGSFTSNAQIFGDRRVALDDIERFGDQNAGHVVALARVLPRHVIDPCPASSKSPTCVEISMLTPLGQTGRHLFAEMIYAAKARGTSPWRSPIIAGASPWRTTSTQGSFGARWTRSID